ncbi:UDP-N-acetylmuramoyl-L-alanine--D-glutamate ligase [Chitinivorax sp. PXF-14]|uniref:UDP-N-acetylmuramoyl-L-alanine--D-glutamate ligase n=1 Tax=Chitinivorax sp. PXF-14 TaxID=3230488 RepID=UPI003465ABF7
MNYQGQQVVVLGAGETGLSCAKWLASHGARVRVADSRDNPPNLDALRAALPGVEILAGAFGTHTFAGCDFAVASPGVPLATPAIAAAIESGLRVVGDVELFAEAIAGTKSKVIAITGANGKTTVTTLVGEMCRTAGLDTVVAGNIGLAVLDALTGLNGRVPDVFVLELSSFQLETTHTLAADAAAVLNVTEDHMDRYAGMADYAAAKARIFHGAGVQVLNREDEWCRGMVQEGRAAVWFGLDRAPAGQAYGLIEQHGETWLALDSQPLLAVDDMQLAGLHNAANALAALALCRAIGLDWAPLLDTLRSFKGLPHRVEFVEAVNGVAYYDDSKGTNVGATVAALNGLKQKAVLIAGGDGKGQDFSPLKAAVTHACRAVVLIGRDAPLIRATLADSGVPLLDAADMDVAVAESAKLAQPADVVLLSPACASLDMFRNYAHRAEVFIAAVKRLPGARA